MRNIAILGSTPALRLAASSIPHIETITCVDFSKRVYDAMSRHVPIPIASERFLECAWQELAATAPSSFDAVVGDKSIDNVPLGEWPSLFSSLRGSLALNGKLLAHVGFPDKSLANTSASELIVIWHARLIRQETTIEGAISGLWEDLLSASYEPNKDVLSLTKFRDEILGFEGTATQDQFLSSWLREFGESWESQWASFDEERLLAEAILCGFQFRNKKFSLDYPASSFQPIYHFVARH